MAGTSASGTRRLSPSARKRLVLLLVLFVAGSIAGAFEFWARMQLSGGFDYRWIYGLIAFDAVLVSVVLLLLRSRELGFGDVTQRLASRAQEQGETRGAAFALAVFDNGLVMQAQRQGAIVSFYLCFDTEQRPYAPSLAEVQAYMRGTGVMRRVQLITKRKGDPSVQAQLEQLRAQLGARGTMASLMKRRPEKRPEIHAPSWIVGVTCFWPKWWQNPDAILNSLDAIRGFLASTQKQTFARTMAAG